MQQLVSSGFVTEVASQRFAAAYQHYTAHAAGVIEQLQEIQGYLRRTAQSLQDADAQLAARLGSAAAGGLGTFTDGRASGGAC